MKKTFYLIEIQYLGFRYHGYQKQNGVKTIQSVLERTLTFVLGYSDFKILPSGRTDALVSANKSYVELFLKEEIETDGFLKKLDYNLPTDVRALSVVETDAKFNVIQHPKIKEYLYLFTFGEKFHPYCAPFMCMIRENLDINMMKEGAKMFEGLHDFRNYVYKPSEKTVFERRVTSCELEINNEYTANFFPQTSYLLRVKGAGFMRHQIRMMMGALILLGRGEIALDNISQSLSNPQVDPDRCRYIAPAYGLMLHNVEMENF